MGFLILPQCALCCCLVPNHLTSYIQESWAWGSIFQYNTLYHIFISLGTKETTSEELLHESNDLLQETSRFTFILLFCSLSNIKMYMHALQSTWVIDVVPCLNTIGYWYGCLDMVEMVGLHYLRRITAVLPLSTVNKQLYVSYATLGSLFPKRCISSSVVQW